MLSVTFCCNFIGCGHGPGGLWVIRCGFAVRLIQQLLSPGLSVRYQVLVVIQKARSPIPNPLTFHFAKNTRNNVSWFTQCQCSSKGVFSWMVLLDEKKKINRQELSFDSREDSQQILTKLVAAALKWGKQHLYSKQAWAAIYNGPTDNKQIYQPRITVADGKHLCLSDTSLCRARSLCLGLLIKGRSVSLEQGDERPAGGNKAAESRGRNNNMANPARNKLWVSVSHIQVCVAIPIRTLDWLPFIMDRLTKSLTSPWPGPIHA